MRFQTDDLQTFAAPVSDLFLKCLTTLPVQASIIATLVACIHKNDAGGWLALLQYDPPPHDYVIVYSCLHLFISPRSV